MNRFEKSFRWLVAYDEASDAAAAAAAAAAEAAAAANKVTFDEKQQEHINSLLAEERRKQQESLQKAVAEVTALRTRVKLSDSERKDLDKRLEVIQQETLTKGELSKREHEKALNKLQTERDDVTKDRDSWKTRFVDTQINNTIMQAATSGKAYNPRQFLAILKPQTQLEEVCDSEGNPTGDFVPKVTFQDVDKEKKPITLKLSVEDALKRMADMDEFANLFANEGSGGLGHRSPGSHQDTDITALASDAKKYRAAKEKGLINLD